MTEPETAQTSSILPFTFDYRLRRVGWATADISSPATAVQLTASYLGDALPDLLSALDRILDGAREASAFWEEEPGHYHWWLCRDGEHIRVRILVGEHTRGFDQASWPATDDDPRIEENQRGKEIEIFETTVEVRFIAAAIANGARDVLLREGAVGYWEKWSASRFPIDLLRSIEAKTSLPRTEMPPPVAPTRDPHKDTLVALWESYLTGAVDPVDAARRFEAYTRERSVPGWVVRSGERQLGADLRRNDLQTAPDEESWRNYRTWISSAAQYDADPMEWHRQANISRLRKALLHTPEDEWTAVAKRMECILERADIDSVLKDHGRG